MSLLQGDARVAAGEAMTLRILPERAHLFSDNGRAFRRLAATSA